jgi:hypothetical protein
MKRFLIALAPLAVIAATVASVASGIPSPGCPVGESGGCDPTWLANQDQADSDTGAVSEGTGGFDAYTRCWHNTHGRGRGTSYESRRMYIYTRWCAKNSKITYWTSSVTTSNGASCHAEGQDGPFLDGGGVGTAAIYVYAKVHFACDIGVIGHILVVHPAVWLDMRYGVQGGVSVNDSGADYV